MMARDTTSGDPCWLVRSSPGRGAGLRDVAEAARVAPAPLSPVQAPDLLLDGLAVRYTDGYATGAPILKKALRAFHGPDMSGEEELRWIWFAATSAADLLDDEAFDAMSSRYVQLARDRGALAMLPMALTTQIISRVLAGDLAAARLLLAELTAVSEGTDVWEPPYAAQLLAAWKGHDKAADLISAPPAEVERRGEGVGVVAAGWMQAVLFNGLGRYEAAFTAASQAVESRPELGVTTAITLVELVTAAARTGHHEVAAGALALAEMTQASGTDWALGLQARCDALVSDADDAESHFRGGDRPSRPTHASAGASPRAAALRPMIAPAPVETRASRCAPPTRCSPRQAWAASRSGPPRSSVPPARPCGSAVTKPPVISPRRKRRSCGWSARDCRMRRSQSGCSSAGAPWNGTSARSSPSSRSPRVGSCTAEATRSCRRAARRAKTFRGTSIQRPSSDAEGISPGR